MQLHEIKNSVKRKKKKRVGRGGKRGTYSGRGVKGQKSRAGAGIKPGFRGGDTPIWKLLPKQRGASRKLSIKQPGFHIRRPKNSVVNVEQLNKYFKDGEVVSFSTLKQYGLISKSRGPVKILGPGKLERNLEFKDILFSKAVLSQIKK